jgi:hypothetical protein
VSCPGGISYAKLKLHFGYDKGELYSADVIVVDEARFNEGFSNADFALRLPAGTHVVDRRDDTFRPAHRRLAHDVDDAAEHLRSSGTLEPAPAAEGTDQPSDNDRAAGAGSEKEADTTKAAPKLTPQKRYVGIIVAEHVILLDNQIVTWSELEKKLREYAAAGPVRPAFHFCGTPPAGVTVEDFQAKTTKRLERAQSLMKKLGLTGWRMGFLSPIASERYDSVRTADDLRRDPSRRLKGTVRLPDGRPVAGATVLVRTQHKWQRTLIYLHYGKLTDPASEQCTKTDDQGRFVVYPPKDDFAVAVLHPQGFRIATSEQIRQGEPIVLQPWATIELTVRQSPDEPQGAGLAVRANEAEGSVPLDFYVFVPLGDKPGQPVKVSMPPGPIELHRIVRKTLVAVELVEQVGPGETKSMELGPATKEHVDKAEEKRGEAAR